MSRPPLEPPLSSSPCTCSTAGQPPGWCCCPSARRGPLPKRGGRCCTTLPRYRSNNTHSPPYRNQLMIIPRGVVRIRRIRALDPAPHTLTRMVHHIWPPARDCPTVGTAKLHRQADARRMRCNPADPTPMRPPTSERQTRPVRLKVSRLARTEQIDRNSAHSLTTPSQPRLLRADHCL